MKIIVAVPVYNEEEILEANINFVVEFCSKNLSDDWKIIIADNVSTDRSSIIAKDLEKKNNRIKYLFVSQKGKGRAIRTAWSLEEADIYIFMDADLAVDLKALPDIVSAVKNGSDLAVGSRYLSDSRVKRSFSRLIFSRLYRLILKLLINLKVSDAPCGLKAINQKVKDEILPKVNNQEWFFDSELVILAERQGYKIFEVPVIWQDARTKKNKSRVNPIFVGLEYLIEVLKLRKR